MTHMIPRFWLFLLALTLAGCGWELLAPLQRMQTGSSAPSASWPVDLKIPLGEVTLSLDDSRVREAVFGDKSVVTGADGLMTFVPEGRDLDPVSFGDKLRIDQPINAAIPPQVLDSDTVQMPAMTLPPIQVSYRDLFKGDPVLGVLLPFPVALDHGVDLTVPDSPFIESQLDQPAGSLDFQLVNNLGLAFQPEFRLFATRNGVRSEIGRTAVMPLIPAGNRQNVSIPLVAGSYLTRVLDVELYVSVPGGQTLAAPATGLILEQFTLANIRTARVKLDLPAQSLQTLQRIPLDIQDPNIASNSIRAIRVESGSLAISIDNRLPLTTAMTLRFRNLFRTGQATPLVETFSVPSGEARTVTLSLDGVSILPENGEIVADVTAETLATGPAGAYFTTDGSQKIEGSVSIQPPIVFLSIDVPVTRTLSLATSSTPIQLPAEFTRMNVKLGAVALNLHLDNQSALTGAIDLDVVGKTSGAPIRLKAKDGGPVRLPFAANRAQDLRIDQDNSNLLDILNALPSELEFGGQVTVDSGGAPVTLSRSDRLGGRLAIEIPLALEFPAFGPGLPVAGYDVTPAKDLGLDETMRARLALLQRLVLNVHVDNGWKIPLGVHLLFSKTPDPYSDPDALTLTLALGNEQGYSVTTDLLLEGADLVRFREASKLGVRLTSPGSSGPVFLRSTAVFRLRLGTEFKALLDAKQLGL